MAWVTARADNQWSAELVKELQGARLDFEAREKAIEDLVTAWLRKRHRQRREDRAHARRKQGVGYLIGRARMYARKSQRELAGLIGSSQANVSRWEAGNRLPTLRMLQYVAGATDTELIVGFSSPRDSDRDFLVLAVLEDEWHMTEIRLLRDDSIDVAEDLDGVWAR